MPSIAGVIYQSAFQISGLIHSISPTFLKNPNSQPFRYFRYKNIEMGSWNVPLNSNSRKSIWAMVSGDICNRNALREELKEAGHTLETEEDAELVVLGYEAFGAQAFFEKINGPFAVALFDEEKEELYLGIDRMGQKALYWTFQGDRFLFSTELKGLLASGIVPQLPSNTSFSSYLFFGFIPQDYCAIESVNKLVPGHFLKVDLKKRMVIDQYWSLSRQLRRREDYTAEDANQELGSIMELILKRATEKRPKIATHLHDTLGSDMITWMLAHSRKREQIDTYTPLFKEKECPILKSASSLARDLNIRHHDSSISVDMALDELPRIIWYLDEPVADPAILQTWNLARQVQQSGGELILDLGWRELMAGHEYYFTNHADYPSPTPFAHTLAQFNPFTRDKLLFPLLRLFNSRLAFRMLRNIRINRNQIAYLAHTALFKGETRKKASPFLYRYFDPEVFTQRFHRLSSRLGDVQPSLYYDLKTALPNHTLLQYNRLLAPFGIKSHAPFLDNEMLVFSASLPDEIKFANQTPGAALVSLWEHLTSQKVAYEAAPLMAPSWSNHPRLRAVFQSLEKGRLVEEGLISPKWLHEMNEMKDLTDIAFRELWSILVLEIWFHLFINRPIGMADHEVPTEELLK